MRRGFSLVVLIFIMMVFAVLAAGFVSLLFSETRVMTEEYNYDRALRIAEAGHSFGLQYLTAFSDWSQPMGFPLTRSFAGGSFTIDTSSEEGDSLILASTGTITIGGQQYQRIVRSTVSISRGFDFIHDFDYAMYAGPPSGGATLRIEGFARIYGDFAYNGPLRLGGAARQDDGTIYSTSLSVYGFASYDSWEAIGPSDLPIWDNSAYDLILAAANTSAASTLTLGSGQTLNLNGQTLYYRSIAINAGATVVGPGTLVATGLPSGTGDINIAYGAGIGSNITFIAQRDFNYTGSFSITNSINVYVKRKINISSYLSALQGSTLYSRGTDYQAINIAGIAYADLLAPYGGVYMSAGVIRGLIYCNQLRTANIGEIRGGIVTAYPSTIQGTIHIYYDADYLPEGLLGLGGTGGISAEAGMSVTNWQEVY